MNYYYFSCDNFCGSFYCNNVHTYTCICFRHGVFCGIFQQSRTLYYLPQL